MMLIREYGYVASYARRAILSVNRPALAHDIRNAMAVIALNVESLELLAGPSGAKVASAAHQLLMRVTALCNDSLRENANAFSAPKRTSFDIVDIVRQVIDTLRPYTGWLEDQTSSRLPPHGSRQSK